MLNNLSQKQYIENRVSDLDRIYFNTIDLFDCSAIMNKIWERPPGRLPISKKKNKCGDPKMGSLVKLVGHIRGALFNIQYFVNQGLKKFNQESKFN